MKYKKLYLNKNITKKKKNPGKWLKIFSFNAIIFMSKNSKLNKMKVAQ